jgi:cell division septum initiation protein DivIVA
MALGPNRAAMFDVIREGFERGFGVMASLSRELLGFNRNEVRRRFKAYETQLSEMTVALQVAEERIARLEAEIEEYKVTVASLRRKVAEARDTTDGDAVEPVVILVGPANVLGDITGLIDDLETVPNLLPRLRVYRDGFYRVEASTNNLMAVVRWLEARDDVNEVAVQDDAIHVVPRGRMVG